MIVPPNNGVMPGADARDGVDFVGATTAPTAALSGGARLGAWVGGAFAGYAFPAHLEAVARNGGASVYMTAGKVDGAVPLVVADRLGGSIDREAAVHALGMMKVDIGQTQTVMRAMDLIRAIPSVDNPTAVASAAQDQTQAGGELHLAAPVGDGALTIEALTQSQSAWYSSNDEECWQGGPYDTREEAEVEAKSNGHRLLLQATKGPVRVSSQFDGDGFIEQAEESLYDLSGEDGECILDFHQDAVADLQTRVRAAIDDWQVAHRLLPLPWRFDTSGPVEIAAWAKSEDAPVSAEGGAA